METSIHPVPAPTLLRTAVGRVVAFLAVGLATTMMVQAWPRRMGDLDGDGRATVVDLVRLKNHLDQTLPLPPELVPFADVTGDQIVDTADEARLIEAIMAQSALPALVDSDSDGVPDLIEKAIGLDPAKADSDGNGIKDGVEDADGDGLTNAQEVAYGTDPFAADSDNDGWPDEAEITAQSDPLDPHSRPRLMLAAVPSVTTLLPSSFTAGRGIERFGMTFASPPVSVILPSSAELGGLPRGITLAQPPVFVILPSAAELSGLPWGITLAVPPFGVVLPASLNLEGLPVGVTLAQPPVSVVLPSSTDASGLPPGITFGRPPLTLVLPAADKGGNTSSGLILGQPPVKVKIATP